MNEAQVGLETSTAMFVVVKDMDSYFIVSSCCLFSQPKTKVTKNADGFFKEAGAKEELSAARKADQKAVDTAVIFPPSLFK